MATSCDCRYNTKKQLFIKTRKNQLKKQKKKICKEIGEVNEKELLVNIAYFTCAIANLTPSSRQIQKWHRIHALEDRSRRRNDTSSSPCVPGMKLPSLCVSGTDTRHGAEVSPCPWRTDAAICVISPAALALSHTDRVSFLHLVWRENYICYCVCKKCYISQKLNEKDGCF